MRHEPESRSSACSMDERWPMAHSRGFHLRSTQVRSLSNEFTLRLGQPTLVTQYTVTLGDYHRFNNTLYSRSVCCWAIGSCHLALVPHPHVVAFQVVAKSLCTGLVPTFSQLDHLEPDLVQCYIQRCINTFLPHIWIPVRFTGSIRAQVSKLGGHKSPLECLSGLVKSTLCK